MHFILLAALLLALVFGPQLWAQHVFRRYSREMELPGTGGELARHLLDRFDLHEVPVEATQTGDHYDPQTRAVRLAPDNYDGKSLTAIAVAAHEVGHAIQHQRGEALLAWRTRLVKAADWAQKLGVGAMLVMPVIGAVTRAPTASLMMLLAGLASLGTATVVHLVTLPVEWDASFGKALPILRQGRYIRAEDEPKVRRILRAAALTYVAASLASLLNLARWIAILRR